MKLFHVYALVRRGEFRPSYIGVTCNPLRREKQHRTRQGNRIKLIVMATFEDWQEASRVEAETVAFYKGRGVRLDNSDWLRPYNPKCYPSVLQADVVPLSETLGLFRRMRVDAGNHYKGE